MHFEFLVHGALPVGEGVEEFGEGSWRLDGWLLEEGGYGESNVPFVVKNVVNLNWEGGRRKSVGGFDETAGGKFAKSVNTERIIVLPNIQETFVEGSVGLPFLPEFVGGCEPFSERLMESGCGAKNGTGIFP